ncbi:SDR family NAD(P)-dependent oxidoreductase [Candidatus Poriferisocius sp.]|uniref:SDR family NAD(P)-dependent oxidoreductase n=1 Tax=Candidatus Poriferisocius sp. TaxID=3101276 RepID=UPI003B013A73
MSIDTPSEHLSEHLAVSKLDVSNMVAVVTGGAGGIGKGIVTALLQRGSTVVIADIEAGTTEATVNELSELGPVSGWATDVSDEGSVTALAEHVYDTHGRCNLLFNNAGVTSGGGGKPWEQEPNDWRWCFGVNVFGVAICTTEFVPRMIAGGRPGQIINTSSGDGGFAPVPTASVYAASKAAVSCFTEALHTNLVREGHNLRASVLYPSGGMMDTGLFTAQRNRPAHLARVGESTGRRSMTFTELKEIMTKVRGYEPEVADLVEHGNFVIDCVEARRFIIARDLEDTVALLHRRAEAIGRFEVPDHHNLGL